jgi:hypothetical protein
LKNVAEIKRTFNRSITKIGVRDCMVLACSALSGDGINESINWMKDCIVRNSTIPPPKRQDIALKKTNLFFSIVVVFILLIYLMNLSLY